MKSRFIKQAFTAFLAGMEMLPTRLGRWREVPARESEARPSNAVPCAVSRGDRCAGSFHAQDHGTAKVLGHGRATAVCKADLPALAGQIQGAARQYSHW